MKYSLQNDRLTATFDTFGGELVSLKDNNGLEYLWQGDKTYWGGHAPVLFPIVGSLRDNRATIGGNKTCQMKRHGTVRKKEFQLKNQTEDTITFSICPDEEMKKQFPYAFELTTRYILGKDSITVEFTPTNQDSEPMPYQIGGHPGFRCPLADGERFEDYVVEFEQTETADCPENVTETGLLDVSKVTRILDHSKILKMSHDLFRNDALVFDKLKSKRVKLYHSGTGRGVALDFAEFDNLLIWSSANDGPFVALEPWNGLSTCSDEGDIFEEKRGVRTLAPGGSKSYSFQIRILPE